MLDAVLVILHKHLTHETHYISQPVKGVGQGEEQT